MIVCAHFHSDRVEEVDRNWLQPSAGVQIASQIDRSAYDVTLHHEMWHGPYGTDVPDADLVFLNGLQKDFDRQRQLSYLFRRKGALVVAGGSICTLFPAFAARFFDAVCSGGVDSVRQVLADFEKGSLRQIYVSPQTRISDYPIDYGVLGENGIGGPVHLVEASRGCNFSCDFCAVPAEKARHSAFGTDRVMAMIDDAIAASPRWSLKRRFPMVAFIDNNFSDDRAYTRELLTRLRRHRRLRVWGALVTQEVLQDRGLVADMAKSGCRVLFTGIESLDPKFLSAHNKRQNMKGSGSLLDDIAFARRRGIAVVYAYLLDARMSTVEEMAQEVRALASIDALIFPTFISFVSPLAGTRLFWESAERGELRPGLRLRDLDGMSVAYRECRSSDEELTRFAHTLFKRTADLVPARRLTAKSLRALLAPGGGRPFPRLVAFGANRRVLRLTRRTPDTVPRTYLGGTEVLDPQYASCPQDISAEDRERYFEPVTVTDADGNLAPWLEPYRPRPRRSRALPVTTARQEPRP
ncbi:radical SAM protein [Streptomyces sp. NPDC047002]|uniref:B12-binding domain-containing radical SAM protein n=1 Tax=Streptomyces sp. NPDC047002 TaxID=3155475 RepID=UPI00345728DC